MKDLKEAKVGDLMFDIDLKRDLVVIDMSAGVLSVKCINTETKHPLKYTVYGELIEKDEIVADRTLFYKGQITENEYLGTSADGVKMFSGMIGYYFFKNSEKSQIDSSALDSDYVGELSGNHKVSAYFSTKEAAEKAQKEHFEPEMFPLPWWLTVLSFDKCPSIRIGSLPFRFSIYNNGWGKVPTDYTDIIPACFVKVQFSELKDGDFFNLGADLNHILLKIHEGAYIRITNEGEVRNQNLGKLSDVFKVVASEIGKESQKVAIGTLSVGEKFSFEIDGGIWMVDLKRNSVMSYTSALDNKGVTSCNLDQLVYKI